MEWRNSHAGLQTRGEEALLLYRGAYTHRTSEAQAEAVPRLAQERPQRTLAESHEHIVTASHRTALGYSTHESLQVPEDMSQSHFGSDSHDTSLK